MGEGRDIFQLLLRAIWREIQGVKQKYLGRREKGVKKLGRREMRTLVIWAPYIYTMIFSLELRSEIDLLVKKSDTLEVIKIKILHY